MDLPSRVLFRDSNLIILDKPAGLAVHEGPKTPVHLEGMLSALSFERQQPPKLAHRLDRDTSGCLLLARHDKALSRLGRLFTAGKITKTYWAIVAGSPAEDSGVIDLPLRKISEKASGWRIVADRAGQAAITEWTVLGRGEGMALLELRPKTGRTHQIRVHCATGLGAAILGDPVYGVPDRPLHLLSRKVEVPYWADRPPLIAIAPLPEHMMSAYGRILAGAPGSSPRNF